VDGAFALLFGDSKLTGSLVMNMPGRYLLRSFVAFPLLIGICSQCVSSLHAVTILGFDPAIHERYIGGALNPNFIVDEGNISGISGRPGSTADRAVLISPFHVVTARHLGSPTVRLRTSSGVFNDYAVDSGPGGFVDLTTNFSDGTTSVSDIRIYRLSEAIPEADGITPISIFDGDASDLMGQQIISFGRGSQAGLNVVRDVILAQGSGSTTTFATSFTYDTDPNNALFDGVGIGETQLVDGDSGRPTLIQIGDDIAFLGPNLGVDPAGLLYDGLYTNFASLLAPYLPEIRSIVEADGFTISTLSVVPEPSSFALLAIAGVGWFGRRRR